MFSPIRIEIFQILNRYLHQKCFFVIQVSLVFDIFLSVLDMLSFHICNVISTISNVNIKPMIFKFVEIYIFQWKKVQSSHWNIFGMVITLFGVNMFNSEFKQSNKLNKIFIFSIFFATFCLHACMSKINFIVWNNAVSGLALMIERQEIPIQIYLRRSPHPPHSSHSSHSLHLVQCGIRI